MNRNQLLANRIENLERLQLIDYIKLKRINFMQLRKFPFKSTQKILILTLRKGCLTTTEPPKRITHCVSYPIHSNFQGSRGSRDTRPYSNFNILLEAAFQAAKQVERIPVT